LGPIHCGLSELLTSEGQTIGSAERTD
jgi:hypothetical protein